MAKRILCANNLHQFGVGDFSYEADSNGWFPTHESDDNPLYGHPGSWSDRIHSVLAFNAFYSYNFLYG